MIQSVNKPQISSGSFTPIFQRLCFASREKFNEQEISESKRRNIELGGKGGRYFSEIFSQSWLSIAKSPRRISNARFISFQTNASQTINLFFRSKYKNPDFSAVCLLKTEHLVSSLGSSSVMVIIDTKQLWRTVPG